MDKGDSAKLQREIVAAMVKGVVEALDDWDLVDSIAGPVFEYVQRCADETIERDDSGFEVSITNDGLSLELVVFAEGEELIIAKNISLLDIINGQYTDCFRSQADIIFAFEHVLQKLKESFELGFGIPCEEAAIDALTKKTWPDQTYEKWKPRLTLPRAQVNPSRQ